MRQIKSKHIIILLLSSFFFSSCLTKKTFNGTAQLDCADHNGVDVKTKKKTKWRLVLYKDGKKVSGKPKKGKSRLFKKKKDN